MISIHEVFFRVSICHEKVKSRENWLPILTLKQLNETSVDSFSQSTMILILYLTFLIIFSWLINLKTPLAEIEIIRRLVKANPRAKGLPRPGIKPGTSQFSGSCKLQQWIWIDCQFMVAWGTDSLNTEVLEVTTIPYNVFVSNSHLNYPWLNFGNGIFRCNYFVFSIINHQSWQR